MSNGREAGVLFSRYHQDGENTADDWDDTLLVKEYDRSLEPLKALVAERMGLSNAELEEASATESGASSKNAVEKRHHKSKHNKKKKQRNRSKQHREWSVGDHCQALFSVDNKLYEATILSIDLDRRTCLVQYVGYGNTEEQPLDAVSHSMGSVVRREQIRLSSLENDLDTEANESDECMEHSSQASSIASQTRNQQHMKRNMPHVSVSSNLGKKSNHLPHTPKIFQQPNVSRGSKFNSAGFSGSTVHPFMEDMVPPPLPPHVISSLPADDSEALSAMLMSWYMSGFHTGYYQGLKRAKSCSPMI